MDLSKFKTSDWLIIGGGIAMLVLGLALKWASFGGFSAGGPFDWFLTGGLAWLLTVGAGVVTFLLGAAVIKASTTPWTLILLAATGLATLLMLIRLIIGPGDGLDRGAGMYVAFVAAAVALVGSVMKFTESGGNLSDLTDTGKLRNAFDRPGGGAPPPPPPPSGGMTPPPPPPSA